MFELFAKQYYECYDDEATIVRLLNQIGKYGRRASAFMTDDRSGQNQAHPSPPVKIGQPISSPSCALRTVCAEVSSTASGRRTTRS